MYITICKTDDLCKFKGGSRAPTAGALGQSRGWGEEGGGRVIQDWGGTCVPWLIRVDVWQKLSQYCKVVMLKLKLIN